MSDEWDDIEKGVLATNPSVTERELIEVLRKHGVDEGAILAEYETLAETVDFPAVRYLATMVMDDERRHHRIVQELAANLAWGGFDDRRESAGVPSLANYRKATPEFLEQTRVLLDFEKRDRAELRRLRKSLDDYEKTTIWTLLVDTMILDTEKHITILHFLLDRITA